MSYWCEELFLDPDVTISYTQQCWETAGTDQETRSQNNPGTVILTLAGETLTGWNSEGVPDHLSGYKM